MVLVNFKAAGVLAGEVMVRIRLEWDERGVTRLQCRWPPEARKGKEKDSTPEPPEETSPAFTIK